MPLQTPMTRRELMVRAGAGLVGGALTGLAGACTAVPATVGQPSSTSQPTGGSTPQAATTLKILMWQGPTSLNPMLVAGLTSLIAARLCFEPLLTPNSDGTLTPVLAAAVPSQANGGLSADGRTVTYTLKPDVKWADGQPFTAEDVLFTYRFVTNKESPTGDSLSAYLNVDRVEALDPLTVRLTFKAPTGGWFVPFAGMYGQILPKHALQDAVGADAPHAAFNLKTFGTGPFMVQDFKSGDLLTMVANPYYRDSRVGKPFFKRLEIKGGGDPISAARAVLETGEYDYGWNLQVEAQVLDQIQQGGKGALVTTPGAAVELILFNMADPNNEIDGERSSPNSHHPFLTDLRVRQALALAVDRATIIRQIWGTTGNATSNILTVPTSLQSPNTRVEFDPERANHILDESGFVRGGDGIRTTPSGIRMSLIVETVTDSLRQKVQALIKDGWQKIGVDTQVKSVDPTNYTSASATADTFKHFNADAELFPFTNVSAFPQAAMKEFYCQDPARDWAQKSNGWSASNWIKWSDADYNRRYDQVLVEADADKARQLWIELNDQLVNSDIAVPLVDRMQVDARSNNLRGPAPKAMDSHFAWNVADWTRA